MINKLIESIDEHQNIDGVIYTSGITTIKIKFLGITIYKIKNTYRNVPMKNEKEKGIGFIHQS